jgi:hypothetical protein
VSKVAATVCTTLPGFPDSNCYFYVHSATKIKRLKFSNTKTEGDVPVQLMSKIRCCIFQCVASVYPPSRAVAAVVIGRVFDNGVVPELYRARIGMCYGTRARMERRGLGEWRARVCVPV